MGAIRVPLHECKFAPINQTLETLTGYNTTTRIRATITRAASHESNGLAIITALLLTDISQLVVHCSRAQEQHIKIVAEHLSLRCVQNPSFDSKYCFGILKSAATDLTSYANTHDIRLTVLSRYIAIW